MKTAISILASFLMLEACTQKGNQVAPIPSAGSPSPSGGVGGAGNAAGTQIGLPGAADSTSADSSAATTAAVAGKINGTRSPDSSPVVGSAGAASAAVGAAGAAGAPGKHAAYSPPPAGYSITTVQQFVAAAQATHSGYHYVYVPPENVADPVMLNELRIAMGKTWNHLNWNVALDIPEDISSGAGLVFAMNAPKIWGAQSETNWGYGAACTARPDVSVSPAQAPDCQTYAQTDPIPIPNFVYNFTNGGPYMNIQQTPPDFGTFQNSFALIPP